MAVQPTIRHTICHHAGQCPAWMNAAARGPVRHADPQRMKETT
jgi:hypothetical protein